MDIRSTLKEEERRSYRKMSRGKRIELAIELSEFTRNLSLSVKAHGKRVQRSRKGTKGSKAA
jgi:hypothetical protein